MALKNRDIVSHVTEIYTHIFKGGHFNASFYMIHDFWILYVFILKVKMVEDFYAFFYSRNDKKTVQTAKKMGALYRDGAISKDIK